MSKPERVFPSLLIDLTDYGFGAFSLWAEEDLDRGVFGKGQVSGRTYLDGRQQKDDQEDGG